MKKPTSIQTPKNRTIGQWAADIRYKGKAYTLPVLHAHNFDKTGHYSDEMKMEDGSATRGQRYDEHLAALTNPESEGLIIVQKTQTDENGTRSNAGYLGVYETSDLKLVANGYLMTRGKQVAMFAK